MEEREAAPPVLRELRRVGVFFRSLAYGIGTSRVVAVGAVLDVWELPAIEVVVWYYSR